MMHINNANINRSNKPAIVNLVQKGKQLKVSLLDATNLQSWLNKQVATVILGSKQTLKLK